MLTAIISMVIVSAVMARKPVLKVVERTSEKRMEEKAREEAIEIYLSRDILDIEH